MSGVFKVAVVGCGQWGKNHVRTFHELGALAAIVDADENTQRELGEKFQVDSKSFSQVLEDSSIGGVVIAAPAELHADLAVKAFEAGKHVFVEKPIATDLADAQKIVSASKKVDKILMVGHLLQYHPMYERLKGLVGEGELGALRYVYSHRLNIGKLRIEEDALWSLAPHDISMVLGLVGEMPNKIVKHDAAYVTHEVADTAHVHFSFASGVSGHIFSSWLNPFKEQRLTVVGDKAMAVFDDCVPWEQKLALYRHEIKHDAMGPRAVKAEVEFIVVEKDEPLRRECQHFLDCAVSGIRPRTDSVEALNVLKFLESVST